MTGLTPQRVPALMRKRGTTNGGFVGGRHVPWGLRCRSLPVQSMIPLQRNSRPHASLSLTLSLRPSPQMGRPLDTARGGGVGVGHLFAPGATWLEFCTPRSHPKSLLRPRRAVKASLGRSSSHGIRPRGFQHACTALSGADQRSASLVQNRPDTIRPRRVLILSRPRFAHRSGFVQTGRPSRDGLTGPHEGTALSFVVLLA